VETENRLEHEISRTMNRMAASEVYHFAAALAVCGSIAFAPGYEGGPLLLWALDIPKHTPRNEVDRYQPTNDAVLQADFVGTFCRLSDRRIQNLDIGLY